MAYIETSKFDSWLAFSTWPNPRVDKAKVGIFDLKNKVRLAGLELRYGIGAKRISVNLSKGLVVTGNYEEGSITATNFLTGKQVWKKKGFPQVQTVEFSRDGEFLMCTFDDDRMQFLDANTGRRRELSPGRTELTRIKRIWENSSSLGFLLETWDNVVRVVSRSFDEICTFPKRSFAIIDVAHFGSSVVVSEVNCPIYSLDLKSGTQTWEFQGGRNLQAIQVCQISANGAIGAIISDREANKTLLFVVNQLDGSVISEISLDEHMHCFFDAGNKVINNDGKVFETITGAELSATTANWLNHNQ